MKVVAISGKIGHGKDTVGELIAQYSNRPVVKISFAYRLKQIANLLTGEPLSLSTNDYYTAIPSDFTREQKKKYLPDWNMTLGEFLQQFAGNVRDGFNPNTWIIPIKEQIQQAISTHGKDTILVITDLRYLNELQYLKKEFNAFSIRVVRTIKDEQGRDHSHASETELDNHLKEFDLPLMNDGTIEDLAHKIQNFIIGTSFIEGE